MTAPDFLALLDRPDPRGVALEDSRRSMSYQELATSVQQMAAGLARLGVDLGDRVAVMLPNSVASVEVYLACAMTGAIWVGVNPAAPEAERQRQRALVTPTLTITEQDLPSLAADETFDAPPPDPRCRARLASPAEPPAHQRRSCTAGQQCPPRRGAG